MSRKSMLTIGMVTAVLAVLSARAISAQDKYTVKVPGGMAFSEFKGYEGWQVISVSQTERAMSVILGNPTIIDAFRSGIPGNAKPFPDGSKMAKIHWITKQSATAPGHAEGRQAVRGQRRMGICRLRIRPRLRDVQTRQLGRPPAASKRRQVRVRVPRDREDERLRLHGVREAVDRRSLSRRAIVSSVRGC